MFSNWSSICRSKDGWYWYVPKQHTLSGNLQGQKRTLAGKVLLKIHLDAFHRSINRLDIYVHRQSQIISHDMIKDDYDFRLARSGENGNAMTLKRERSNQQQKVAALLISRKPSKARASSGRNRGLKSKRGTWKRNENAVTGTLSESPPNPTSNMSACRMR